MELTKDRYRAGGVDLLKWPRNLGRPCMCTIPTRSGPSICPWCDPFPDVDLKIKYACKANTNLSLFRFLRSIGSRIGRGVDGRGGVGVAGRISPCRNTFYAQRRFVRGDPAWCSGWCGGEHRQSFHARAIRQTSLPIVIRVAFWLNPHILAGGNTHIQTGHIDSKFGI